MAETIRDQILDALLLRAAVVSPSCFCVPSYVPAELPATTIFDDVDDTQQDSYGNVAAETPVIVETYAEIPAGAGFTAVKKQGQELLGQLIQQMTQGDRTLGGLCDSMFYSTAAVQYPDDGDNQIAAAITVRVMWSHAVGDPYTRND